MDRHFERRCALVLVGLAAVFSLLSVRLVHVQWKRPMERVAAHPDGTLPRAQGKEILPAKRGLILDRDGRVLVGNEPEYRLVANRRHIEDPGIYLPIVGEARGIAGEDVTRNYSEDEAKRIYVEIVASTLAPFLGCEPADLQKAIRDRPSQHEIPLAAKLDAVTVEAIEEALAERGIRGIEFRERLRRFHPSPGILTHVLGYTHHDEARHGTRGADGVEAYFDEVLTGTAGWRTFELGAGGAERVGFELERVEPVPGQHVRLTIDFRLQELLEIALDEVGSDPDEIYLPEIQAEKVSVVVMDPMTGEVLAMANRPHFDLETRVGERTNASVSHVYEPGSTFKLVALTGALEHGLVGLGTQIHCENGYWAEHKLRDHHPYARLSTEEIIIKSSNIGAFKLALQLGSRRFHSQALAFGFGRRTGIELPSETGGLLYPPEKWSRPSFSRMAMGYEVAVTPTQMAAAYGSVANGGRLLRARLLLGIDGSGPDGQPVLRTEPELAGTTMSPRTADQVRRVLTGVTAPKGTATRAAIPGYTVAGKTGTSQKYDPVKRRYVEGRYVLSFVGFVPADNPKLVAAVVIDSPRVPREELYGGRLAAPVFRRYMERALKHLGIPPDQPILASESP